MSNRESYEDRLFVVPSAYTGPADVGLRFHHVPGGNFEWGGTSANAMEAQVLAKAVMRDARECPHLSLGVASFSATQRCAQGVVAGRWSGSGSGAGLGAMGSCGW